MRLIKMARISALLAALMMAISALAEQGQYAGIEEIVVTAQKREATLQDTPVAVSVVSGEDLTNIGIADIQELEMAAPSLNTGQNQSSSQQTFSIRGLGTSGNNAGLALSRGFY